MKCSHAGCNSEAVVWVRYRVENLDLLKDREFCIFCFQFRAKTPGIEVIKHRRIKNAD